jgi:hypothetical protein
VANSVHQNNARDEGGKTVAAFLAGAWRRCPPRLDLHTSNLTGVAPLLIESGAAALGWWRIRHCDRQVRPERVVRRLRETYYCYAIHAAQHERDVVQLVAVLRAVGVEPILIKGWAVGRFYPETGLRPTGDIDLYVSPDQYASAQTVLSRPEYCRYRVDLDHDQMTRFHEPSFEELHSRSELVELDGTMIRVLGAEDNLRILCLHLLKHGAWRPLWLCDVAVALESRPSHFNWDCCLGRDQRRANWILCAIVLAQRLLGAHLGDTPFSENILPRWLIPSVMEQWNAPSPPNLLTALEQIRKDLLEPRKILDDLRKRWPNPIQATMDANGPFNEMSRLPFQIGSCCVRAVKLLRGAQRSRVSSTRCESIPSVRPYSPNRRRSE